MAIELSFTNNLTYYTSAYSKIIKFEDDTINRKLKILVGFFADEKESHSTSRIIMIDEVIYEGDEYQEIQENYAENSDMPRKNAYTKIQLDYSLKWESVVEKQNTVGGLERPYRDKILSEKTVKDGEFKVKGDAYKEDPESAVKRSEAREKHKEVVLQQNEFNDVLYGEMNEYPDKPIKYSDDFEVALEQIPE